MDDGLHEQPRRREPRGRAAHRDGKAAAEHLGDDLPALCAEVFRGGLAIAVRGAAAGLAAAWLFVQAIIHIAPGFGLPAVWMWPACPLILTMVVGIASILPARYALAVDPLTLTREE